MRIDVVSIFPAYLDPLELSLLGKARQDGLVTLDVHDLRDWTHDRHRTVDDTPYGGGAGMVMRPEPWGEALDFLIDTGKGQQPRIIVPTPAGRPFTQAMASELAAEPWLLFASGRYEGIDERVVEHYRGRLRVDEVSIGDYVLNGGEVAVMVIIEAVTRLLPGFVGNAGSLTEESHGVGDDGALLEYPVYTKPAWWRGLDVPAVLLSGDHGRIASWRHDKALRRTVERRPDLLRPSILARGVELTPKLATQADAAELLTLQRACWVKEAQANDMLDVPALVESLPDVREDIGKWRTWVVRVDGRLVASVRARLVDTTWEIGRLMVAPDLEGRGIGRAMLEFVQAQAPQDATAFELTTGARSVDNHRMYAKAGFRRSPEQPADNRIAILRKPRPSGPAAGQ